MQTYARTYSPDSGEFVYFSVNSSVYCQKRGVAFGKALSNRSFLAPSKYFSASLFLSTVCNVGRVGETVLDPRKLTRSPEQLREVGRRLVACYVRRTEEVGLSDR